MHMLTESGSVAFTLPTNARRGASSLIVKVALSWENLGALGLRITVTLTRAVAKSLGSLAQ